MVHPGTPNLQLDMDTNLQSTNMKTPRNRNLKNASSKPTEGFSYFDDSHNKSRTAAGRENDLSHISPFSHKMFNFSGTGASFKVGGHMFNGTNYYYGQ